MFEPPEGTADFNADATAAEQAEAEAELARMEEDVARRKAELAHRTSAPQVIDIDGSEVDTTIVTPVPWPHQVIELQGKPVQVKLPAAAAVKYLTIFGFGEEGRARGDFQDFMHRHVSAASIDEIKDWSYSGEIDENFYDELMQKLITERTARPTGPSSSSPRSR